MIAEEESVGDSELYPDLVTWFASQWTISSVSALALRYTPKRKLGRLMLKTEMAVGKVDRGENLAQRESEGGSVPVGGSA